MSRLLRSFILVMIMSLAASATIRVVDGVGASGSGRFAKIADAITTAVAGDTVLVLPGIYREADLTIDKRIVLLGSGYRDVKNGGTHIAGEYFSVADAADGAKIQGFRFLGGGIYLNGNVDNVLIANNFFSNGTVYFYGNTGDTVRNNIFVQTTAVNPFYSNYNIGLSNIVIANNIITGSGNTNNLYAIYLRVQGANQNNIQIVNNFIEKFQYVYGGDWGVQPGVIFAGNIFHKVGYIAAASNALLYSGNWKFDISVGITEPSGGTDNGSGDLSALFNRFDQAFDYKDNPSTDTDLRFKSSTTPYPDSPIDGGAQAIAPLGSWYVDFLQGPGATNTNRADGGIYGGPYPFGSSYGSPNLPAVTNLTVNPAVASPSGTIQINASGTVTGYPGRNN